MSAAARRRRILVLLDASPESLAAAEATVELAAALGAELVGLFVEETELLALAGQPLTRAVDPFTATLQPLETPVLERRLRVQAARARERLARLAGGRGVGWSFRVERGDVLQRVEVARAGVDFVSVARVGWSRGLRRLGGTARAVLTSGSGSVLLHGRPAAGKGPVVTCVDGSERSLVALALAAEIAERRGALLEVAIVGEGEEELRRLGDSVRAALAARDRGPRYALRSASREALLDALRAGGCALLVVGADGPVSSQEIEAWVDAIEAPLLLVR